ncbi:MAG: bacterial Ig-like domain-containing protein [Spirochaetia bacterium]|nr:bacterial Ig-like domain-containing protein [Spirochaetia bacterium]MDY3887567.1 bacterial Ig-like domain-containing protein [Treponema sp.]
MNKTSLKSKKLAKVLFAILFGTTILTGCENNVSESDKTIDNPSNPSVPSVVGEKINSVSITKEPIKTQYEVGDKFDATGLEVNVNKTTSYSDNTTKTSDVSVKYVDEKDSFKFIFDSSKAGTVNVSVSYKDIKVDNTTLSVIVSEKGGNETPSTTTTIKGIEVENNVISLESLDNISDLQTLSEAEKEIAKTVKTLNIKFPEKEDKTNHSVNLVDISKLATNFPNAKITASDNIEYAINGGTGRNTDISSLDYDTIEDDFKDLTQFEIDGKIKIVKSIDYSTTDLVDDSTEIKIITVGNGTKLNITGKYLDIGRNRFISNVNNDNITLPSDIEITTYNRYRRSITSDIAIDQYKQLGLTTPKFDLSISDENAYNFAKNILENYSYDQLNSVDSDNVKEHKLSMPNSRYVDGKKALYTDDTLNANVPSLKYDTLDFIDANIVRNLVITGTPSVKDTTSSRGYTNVVFTGDMSSITNSGNLRGVIEFKDNPMKDILSSVDYNTLIRVNKIDAPIGTIRARILDFRGLPDYDNYSPLISNVKIGGTGDITGYFKNTAQKKALKDKIIDIDDGYHLNDFNPAYSEDVDTEKAQMKTLQSVAEEADESIKQQTALY